MLEIIKAWCKENDIPISELEKICGFSKGTISRWKKSHPRMNSLKAVCKITGIKPSDFYEADEELLAANRELVAANKKLFAASKEQG